MATDQKFYFKRGDYTPVSMPEVGSAQLAAGDPVELGTGGVQAISAHGNLLFGISDEEIAADGKGRILVPMGMVVEGDLYGTDNPDPGDVVYIRTDGLITTTAGAGNAAGRVVDFNPSAGQKNIRVLLFPVYA